MKVLDFGMESRIKWNSKEIQLNWRKNGLHLTGGEKQYDSNLYYEINQSLFFQNTLSIFLILEDGKSYIIDASININDDLGHKFGIWVIQEGKTLGYDIAGGKASFIGTKIKSGKGLVEIRVGFKNRGFTRAMIKSISVQLTDEIASDFKMFNAQKLNLQLGLKPFDSVHYHRNILSIVTYVNALLISPLNNFYKNSGDGLAKKKILDQEDSIKKTRSFEVSLLYPNTYFDKLMKMSVREMGSAYCVKSSLSVRDVLSGFNIPVNQLHFKNKKGEAIHQSVEYWHPYANKWIIIDPFYGICYKDKTGIMLGFDELKSYASQLKIDSTFLISENIQPFYFNLDELRIIWNDKMFRGKANFEKQSITF